MDARAIDRYRLLILLIVAIAARGATFGNPDIHIDEEFYLYVARRMTDGALPFVDVWDRKPIGLFLLYLLPALLPYALSIWAYQALAWAAAVGTGWIVGRIAERAGWQRGATVAGIIYILLLDWVGGQGGQAPVFYNLPMALAALLVLRGGPRMEMAAMLAIGIALQIKYTVLFEGVFIGLYIMVRHWRAGARWSLIPRAARLIGIALAPTVAVFVVYLALGQGEAFWYANFLSILDRGPDPLDEQLRNLATLALWLALPVTLAAIGLKDAGEDARVSPMLAASSATARRFVGAWLMVALASLILFGGWYLHYALPVMLPAAVACAALSARRPRVALAFVIVAAIVGQGVIVGNRIGRGTPTEFDDLAARLRAGPAGCLYVYSGPPGLYDASGRCALSRFVFPSHLYRSHEIGAIGADQRLEVSRIMARAPAMVVLRPFSTGERRDIRALVEHDLTQHYRQLAPAPLGNERLQLWVHR